MSHENASLGVGFVGETKTQTEQKQEAKEQVTKDWTIGDVVKKYPSAVEVMLYHGLH